MKFINLFRWLIFIPLLSISNLIFAQGQAVIVDEIIAKIDNYIILKSDLEGAYESLIANGKTPSENERCKILKQLIISKLLVVKAEIDSITVEDSQVNSQLNRRMQYFIQQFGSESKLETTLGKSILQLKEELRDQVKEQLITQKMQSEITADIKITPSQVRKYFNKMPKDSIPFLAAEVEVAQIVKYPTVSKKEKQKVKDKLSSIREQIIDGAEFGKMARTHSQDYGTATKGGDLGWQGRGIFAPEFEATVLTLEANEISTPIETEFGLHIIQLLGRRGNSFHSRHILIRPKANNLDIKGAGDFLDSLKNIILLDSISFENAAMKHSDDKATRPNAGYFKSELTGNTAVSTENLESTIFFTIDTMKVNTISPTMHFRTEDGKAAVRIIYYKSQKSPHYANMKDDYQKIQLAAKNNRQNTVLGNWLKKAKSELYIQVEQKYNKCNIVEEL